MHALASWYEAGAGRASQQRSDQPESPHVPEPLPLDQLWHKVEELQANISKSKVPLPACLRVSEEELQELPRTTEQLLGPNRVSAEKLQHRFNDVLQTLQFGVIFLNSNLMERAKLLSMVQKGASAYLQAIPSESGLVVPSAVFAWMLSRRLGCKITAQEDEQAGRDCDLCGERYTSGGPHSADQHPYNCKRGGGLPRRHDRLFNACCDMFEMVGFRVRKEPRGKFHPVFGNGGPDGEVLGFPVPGFDTILEFSTVNQATALPASACQPLKAAARREAQKFDKYAKVVATLDRKQLRVAVIETGGGIGKQLADTMAKLGQLFKDSGRELPETTTWTTSAVDYWRQKLSVALCVGAGEMRALMLSSQQRGQAQADSAQPGANSNSHGGGATRTLSSTRGRGSGTTTTRGGSQYTKFTTGGWTVSTATLRGSTS